MHLHGCAYGTLHADISGLGKPLAKRGADCVVRDTFPNVLASPYPIDIPDSNDQKRWSTIQQWLRQEENSDTISLHSILRYTYTMRAQHEYDQCHVLQAHKVDYFVYQNGNIADTLSFGDGPSDCLWDQLHSCHEKSCVRLELTGLDSINLDTTKVFADQQERWMYFIDSFSSCPSIVLWANTPHGRFIIPRHGGY